MTYLLCNVIEDANEACTTHRKFVKSNIPEKRVNVAQPLDYDMLATGAARRGDLFDLDKFTRRQIANKIKQYHESELGLKVKDFPLICPSTHHIMSLYNASKIMEDTLFPNRKNSSALEATFQKRLQSKAFCNVNVTNVLEDETWISFFKSL